MKNLLSVLPILSAVFFAVPPQNEMGIVLPNADIDVLSVIDHLFDLPKQH